MRLLSAIKGEMRFQYRQGIYAVYIVITIFYRIVVGQLPEDIQRVVIPFIVFSDPSVIGFFFMGGIIMLEKVQGVTEFLAVTPLRTKEYIFAKIIAFACIGELASFAIVTTSYRGNVNYIILFIGILLTSIFFTLLGFMAAIKCKTMNQYFLKMVPYMIFGIVPCISVFNIPYINFLRVFPSVFLLKIVLVAFDYAGTNITFMYIAYGIAINTFMFIIINKIIRNKLL